MGKDIHRRKEFSWEGGGWRVNGCVQKKIDVSRKKERKIYHGHLETLCHHQEPLKNDTNQNKGRRNQGQLLANCKWRVKKKKRN